LTVVPAAFSASSLRQKRGTSSNSPRLICHRQHFGEFLESASLHLPQAALRRFPLSRLPLQKVGSFAPLAFSLSLKLF
ncbi:MAG: hypothetical protein IJA51_01925, partial [Oscillospiraceae bacterium]|nr:hypothetical protein [Oscillospiraceae bacterium]